MAEQRQQMDARNINGDADRLAKLEELSTEILVSIAHNPVPLTAQNIDELYKTEWRGEPIPFWEFGCDDLETFLLTLDTLVPQRINDVWHFSGSVQNSPMQPRPADANIPGGIHGRGRNIGLFPVPAPAFYYAGFGRGLEPRMLPNPLPLRRAHPVLPAQGRGARPYSLLDALNATRPGPGNEAVKDVEDNLKLLRRMYPTEDEHSLRSLLQKCGNDLTVALDKLVKDSSDKNKSGRSEEGELAATVDRKRKLNGGGKVDSWQKERLSAEQQADKAASDAPGPSGLQMDDNTSTIAPSSDPLCLITVDDVQKVAGFLNEDERDVFNKLCVVFPDADPSHIVKLIVVNDVQESKNAETIAQMMLAKGYPKLRDRLERERRERRRDDFLDATRLDVDEFLRIFDDPEVYFCDPTRKVSDSYVRHALVFLMNTFMNMRREFLQYMLEQHDKHLLPAYREIQAAEANNTTEHGRPSNKRRHFPVSQYLTARERRTEPEPWPNDLDEGFFREVQFISNEAKIRTYMENKRKERESRLSQAQQNGDLVECPICLNEGCLPEDLLNCSLNQHSFCRDCVRQHSDAQIGSGGHRVSCMAEGCAADLGLEILQTVLGPETFSLLVRRQQTAVLRQADIENLEQCPYCDFSMIIENVSERLFRCRNRDCLKETCRECRKPSHIPLHCDEVERDEETRMRTFVEERMAEALIRTCPTCRCRIVKSDGCNKLVCTSCGSAMCYVCKQLLPAQDPYSHFNQHPHRILLGGHPTNGAAGNAKCPLHTSDEVVHDEVARRAGEEAKKRFRKENPDVKTRNEKDIDVNQLVDSSSANGQTARMPFLGMHMYHQHRPRVNIGLGALYVQRFENPRQPDAQELANQPQARMRPGFGRGRQEAVPGPQRLMEWEARRASIQANLPDSAIPPPPFNVPNAVVGCRLPSDFRARVIAVAKRLNDAVVCPATRQLRYRVERLHLECFQIGDHNPDQALRVLRALEAEVADIIGMAESQDLNARIAHLESQVNNALDGQVDGDIREQLNRQMQGLLRLSHTIHTQRRLREVEAMMADIGNTLGRLYVGATAVGASSKVTNVSTEEESPDQSQQEQLASIQKRIKLAQERLSNAVPFSAEVRAAVTELSGLIDERQRLNALHAGDSPDASAREPAISMRDFEEQKRTVLNLDEKVRTLQKTAADCVVGSLPERDTLAQLKTTMRERDAAILRRHELRDQLLRRGAKETDFGPDSDGESDTGTDTASSAKAKSIKREPKTKNALPECSQTKKAKKKGRPTQMPPEVADVLRHAAARRDHKEALRKRANLHRHVAEANCRLYGDWSSDFDEYGDFYVDDGNRLFAWQEQDGFTPKIQAELEEHGSNNCGRYRWANDGNQRDAWNRSKALAQARAARVDAERIAESELGQQEAVAREQARIQRWEQLSPVVRQTTTLLNLFEQAQNLPENAEIVRQIEEVVLLADDRGHEFNWPELLTTAREFVTARTPNVGIRMLELLHAFIDSLQAAVGEGTPDAHRERRVGMWRALLTERLSSLMLKEAQATGTDATVTDKAKMALMVAERERQINDEQRVLMEVDRRQREIAERVRLERLQHEEAERVARLRREKERSAALCPFCLEHDTYRAEHADCPFRDCSCSKCNARRRTNERRRLEQRLDHLRGRLAAEAGLLRDLNHLGADHEQQQRGAVERLGADVERLRTQITDQTREMERIRVEREQNEADLIRAEATLLVHRRRLLDSQAQQRRRHEVQVAEARLAEEVRVTEHRLAQLADDEQKLDDQAAVAQAAKFDEKSLCGLIQEYIQKGFDMKTIESQLRNALDMNTAKQADGPASSGNQTPAAEVEQAIVLSSDEEADDVPAVVFQSPSGKKRHIKRERKKTADRDASSKNPDDGTATSSPISSQPVRLSSVQDYTPRAGQCEPATVQSANIHINIHLVPKNSQRTNEGDPAVADESHSVQPERNGLTENDLMDVE